MLGNIDIIGTYAFANCSKLSTVKYYGIVEPTASSYALLGTSSLFAVQVTSGYTASTLPVDLFNKHCKYHRFILSKEPA